MQKTILWREEVETRFPVNGLDQFVPVFKFSRRSATIMPRDCRESIGRSPGAASHLAYGMSFGHTPRDKSIPMPIIAYFLSCVDIGAGSGVAHLISEY